MLNKLILNRFFFRKNQDSSSDFVLPLLFMSIVSLSTILIFLSSLQLYDFQLKKDQFLSNKWNHIYDLYIGQAKYEKISGEKKFYEFENYIDSLQKTNDQFNFSKSSYPLMLHLSSNKNDSIRSVLTHTFDYKDTVLFDLVSNHSKEQILSEPTMYLDKRLMKALKIDRGDYLLAKQAMTYGYKGLYKVEPIEGDTRIKSYLFSNFLNSKINSNLIRFYFNNINSAYNFIADLYKNLNVPTPYNVGFDGISHFTLIEKNLGKNIDFITGVKVHKIKSKIYMKGKKLKKGDIITHINKTPITSVSQFKNIINNHKNKDINISVLKNRGKSKSDERYYTDVLIKVGSHSNLIKSIGFDIISYEDNTLMKFQNLKNRTTNSINEELITISSTNDTNNLSIPYQGVINNPDGSYTIEKPRIFIDDFLIDKSDSLNINIPGLPKEFYVEVELYDVLEYKERKLSIETDKIQISLLNAIKKADSVSFHQNFSDFKKTNKKYFMNAKDLDNDLINKEIMGSLNSMNVRWDNGRWKTILNLNKSLEEGKRNIIMLIITNFLAFLLILIIKFLLRLKLELHTIGVLKCFGYSKKIIFTTYNIGNLLIIISGFLIGFIPLGIMLATFIGYDFSTLISFYQSSYATYSLIFFVAISLVSLITTSIFLNIFTEKENIYELIKYEG